MAFPQDNYGVIMQRRLGTNDDPFISISETINVVNSIAVLKEVPDKSNHVIITDSSGNLLYETYDNTTIPATNEFIVNYNNGNITFNSANNNKQFTASYLGTGAIYLNAKRVFTQVNNSGGVVQDLQDMIDNYNQLNGTDLYNLFDPETGHRHTGKPGDAPSISGNEIIFTGSGNVSGNVSDTLISHTTKLEENEQQLGTNVTNHGAVGDGTTLCDTALTEAMSVSKTKKIYFPQNDTNNAIYYFNGNPFANGALDGFEIVSDEGVILSISTLNAQPLRNSTFGNYMEVYARDRDNYAYCYAQPDDFLSTTFSSNEIDLGVKFPTIIKDNDGVILKENLNGDGSTDSSNYILTDTTNTAYAHGFYIDATVNTNDVLGLYHVLGLRSKPGSFYSAGFFALAYETSSSVRLGVAAWKDQKNFALVTLDLDNIYFGNINLDNGTSWTESTVMAVDSKLTNAYGLRGLGFNIAIRQITNTSFDVLLNGVSIGTFTTPFNIAKIGSCINHFNANGNNGTSGIKNWYMLNPIYEIVSKSYIGDKLNVAAFGDSITHTEGCPISWANYLPKLLKGQRGITSVTVSNNAYSGDTSAQQLTKMQAFNFTGYDTVCILIGTNDILQNVDLTTFQNNIQSMINLASPSTRKVIFGIPPLWTSREFTNQGVTLSNWDKGINYRECVKYMAINNGCHVVECDYEIGKVTADNSTDLLRDNLHPNTYGESVISRAFARGVIRSHTKDVSPFDVIYETNVIDPVYQNGWTDFSIDYKTTIEKESSGMVTITGTMKAPAVPLTNGQLIFTLPNGYIPRKNIIVNALNNFGSSQSILSFDLSSNGNLTVNSGGSLTGSDFISFCITFLAK